MSGDTLPPNIGPSTSDPPELNVGPSTADTLPPNIAPAGRVICYPATGQTGDGTPCVPVCDPGSQKYDDSTSCDVTTTTSVGVVARTLPTTGQATDGAVTGAIILVLGVVAHRLARRKLISR